MRFVPNERTGIVEPIFDRAFIDKKHFLIFKEKVSYYLVPDEDAIIRKCKSKKYVTKVMFLACVARPRVNPLTGEVFNGKIGIYPFVHTVEAKRNSKNREAGTPETKCFNVTREISRTYLVDKVIPDIRSKWPRWYFDMPHDKSKEIIIQQDNAKPHCLPNDPVIVAAGAVAGYNIVVRNQPANNPDLNVLDLGIFNAIDKLQHTQERSSIDELVAAVVVAFNLLPVDTIDRCFMMLQAVMSEVLSTGGDNTYRMPHLRKSRLVKVFGVLPKHVRLKPQAIKAAQTIRAVQCAEQAEWWFQLFGEEEEEE